MRTVEGSLPEGLGSARAVVAVPTDGTLTPMGLVMGAGAARLLARSEPRLPLLFAEAAQREGRREGKAWIYGFVAVETGGRRYGAFQTRSHFRREASLELTRFSASRLREFLEAHPGVEVHMAFPDLGPEALEVLEEELGPAGRRVTLYRLPEEEEGSQPPLSVQRQSTFVRAAKHLGLGREEFRAWARLLLGKAEGEKFTEEDFLVIEKHLRAFWDKAGDSDFCRAGFRLAFRKRLKAGRPLTGEDLHLIDEETQNLLDLMVIPPEEIDPGGARSVPADKYWDRD